MDDRPRDTVATDSMGDRKSSTLVRRFLAFSSDSAVIALYALLLFLAVRSAQALHPDAATGPMEIGGGSRAHLAGFLALTLPTALAFSLLEASSFRGTPGKRLLGLEVVGVAGGGLGFGASLVRNTLKFLPWELSHWSLWRIDGWPTQPQDPPPATIWGFALTWALVALYVGSLVVSKDTVSVYDRLAGARVQRRRHRPELPRPTP